MRRVGAHRHVRDRELLLARLDHRLERVREVGEDVQLEGGAATERTEAARRVRDARPRELADDPAAEALQEPLRQAEVRELRRIAIADDDVGVAAHDRRDQRRDVVGTVLIVGVGVDDHVGAELERALETGGERARQALMVGKAHDLDHAGRFGDLDRAVRAPVVDDHHDDVVDAGERLRQSRERLGERLFFVQTGDLDHELHLQRACHSPSGQVKALFLQENTADGGRGTLTAVKSAGYIGDASMSASPSQPRQSWRSVAWNAAEAAATERIRALLAAEYPREDVATLEYCEWLLRRNPSGDAIIRLAVDADGTIAGQYVVIPVQLTIDGTVHDGALSLLTLVDQRYRGQGVFTTLARDVIDDCAARGRRFIIVFPNQNSYPGFTRALGFRDIGSVPLLLRPLKPSRLVQTRLGPTLGTLLRPLLAPADLY